MSSRTPGDVAGGLSLRRIDELRRRVEPTRPGNRGRCSDVAGPRTRRDAVAQRQARVVGLSPWLDLDFEGDGAGVAFALDGGRGVAEALHAPRALGGEG